MARIASSDWLTTRGVELVVLEHVACHHDELGARLVQPAPAARPPRRGGRPNTAAAPRR